MTDKTKKTIEEYERLAARLAEDRDGARDVANRLAQEKKLLAGELKPLLERVSVQLGGGPSAETAFEQQVLREKAMWYNAIVAIVDGADPVPVLKTTTGNVPPAISLVLALVTKHKFNEHLEKSPTPKLALPPKAKRKPKKRARR